MLGHVWPRLVPFSPVWPHLVPLAPPLIITAIFAVTLIWNVWCVVSPDTLDYCLWGILEYLVQRNNNTTSVRPYKKFKFIDDLIILEMINLIISIGLANHNFKSHVPSKIS